MAMHVSFGSEGEHEVLPQLASEGGTELWTLAAKAKRGDTVVFYIKSPVSSFVASGQVLDDRRVDGARYGRSGQMGTVGKIKMLGHEVHLRDARDATPGWGWLKQPHTNITVPPEYEAAFWASLKVSASGGSIKPAEPDPGMTALENVLGEAKVLTRSRNRALRDAVIEASGGKCAGCLTAWHVLEPLLWRSLLQAHHTTPLHELDEPTVNRIEDLVAFCPTCHVLAHLGGSGVRSVAEIRGIYRRR